MISQIEFMNDCGNKMKKEIIEEFEFQNKIVLMNKITLKTNPSRCLRHYIRMHISKMKILNGYLKVDVDYMQKQHEIFKENAMIVIEEYEDKMEHVTTLMINQKTMNASDSQVYKEEGGYLHICNIIKAENNVIEDYIDSVKKMNKMNLHF